MHSRLFSALVVLVLFSAALYGQQGARNPKKEQVIWEKLAAVAPEAVQTFKQATVALDNRDYPQAAQLYREVTRRAPTFSPALRRLGFSLADWARPTMHSRSSVQTCRKLTELLQIWT